MSSTVKVSVIVPIYKVEKYLCQCIDSILAQTLKDIEVILVDEGDIDACRAICDMYEFGPKKDERIKTIHEKNGGYGASCNKGFDRAKGEYISIIEPDDFIEPEMYEEMYAYAKKLDADVVKTPYYEYKDKTKLAPATKSICHYADRLTQECPQNQTFSVLDYPQLMGVHASLWSGIYKTSYMRAKNIRFVQAKGGAYVDVGFRIDTLINTDKVAWYPKAFYNYRLTNDGSSTNNFNLTVMLERWTEVHERLDPEIYRKIGPELYWDEFTNTIGYLFTDYPVTKEHLKTMQDNLRYVDDEVINKCKKLKGKRRIVFAVKQGQYYLKYTLQSKLRRHGCRFYIGKKLLVIHLFRNLKHNIIRCIFRLGGIYVIDICIGKVKEERKLDGFSQPMRRLG